MVSKTQVTEALFLLTGITQLTGDLAPERCWEGSKAHAHLSESCFGTAVWLCFQAGWQSRSSLASGGTAISIGGPSRSFLEQVFSRAGSPSRSPCSSGSAGGFGVAPPSKALSLSFPSGHPGQASLRGDMDASVVGRPCRDTLWPRAAAHSCAPASAAPSGEEGGVMAAIGGAALCHPSPACLVTPSPAPSQL